jgi:methionine synthase II (cobalamin-independent)
MPSPITFVKNLLIWVDDIPSNNSDMVKGIEDRGVEVIQLTSTRMAEKWAQEFSWLLNWMDVKFKVVSDMVRVEDGVNNYYAGIDLLERFYNIKGYSTPILVFCGDTTRGKENAEMRKIKGSSIYKITNKQSDLD